jgi:hypothetical protein
VAQVRKRTIPGDRRLPAKLVPTFSDRGMSAWWIPYGRDLGFLDQSRYFFFQVAPQLFSQGWVDPVPDPLLHRKSGSAGNRTWTFGYVARNSDQKDGLYLINQYENFVVYIIFYVGNFFQSGWMSKTSQTTAANCCPALSVSGTHSAWLHGGSALFAWAQIFHSLVRTATVTGNKFLWNTWADPKERFYGCANVEW